MSEFDGEEDPQVLQAVREDRSRSRERDGYIEVTASGRGGRGNIRSHSRGRDLELGRVPTVLEEQERMDIEDEELRLQELLRKRERDGPDQWVSTGRGKFATVPFVSSARTDLITCNLTTGGAGNFFNSWRRNSSNARQDSIP